METKLSKANVNDIGAWITWPPKLRLPLMALWDGFRRWVSLCCTALALTLLAPNGVIGQEINRIDGDELVLFRYEGPEHITLTLKVPVRYLWSKNDQHSNGAKKITSIELLLDIAGNTSVVLRPYTKETRIYFEQKAEDIVEVRIRDAPIWLPDVDKGSLTQRLNIDALNDLSRQEMSELRPDGRVKEAAATATLKLGSIEVQEKRFRIEQADDDHWVAKCQKFSPAATGSSLWSCSAQFVSIEGLRVGVQMPMWAIDHAPEIRNAIQDLISSFVARD